MPCAQSSDNNQRKFTGKSPKTHKKKETINSLFFAMHGLTYTSRRSPQAPRL